MANNIALAKKYIPLLDEVYQQAAKTAVLDADPSLVREAAMANEILLPKTSMQGLGDYDRNTGFVSGDVTLEWQTHQFTQDRGRSFQIDAMDDEETAGIAFGTLAAQFIRTKVVPEIDAYRFATMFGKSNNTVQADLTNATVDEAIGTGEQVMDDAEVPEEGRWLFVSSEVNKLIKESDNYVRNLDMNSGGGINRNFAEYDEMPVVKVPRARFYTSITLYDGTTGGQEAGGYIKTATTGRDLNFMIVQQNAVLGIKKHVMPRIFDPETNQSADAWKFDYRIYHDLFVPDNKTDGIYAHNKTT